MSQPWRVPIPIRIALAINLVLGMLYLGNTAAGRPFRRVTRFVNLTGEANLPAWYSSLQWSAVAACFGFLALRARSRGGAWSLPATAVAVVALLFSLDETATMHESLSSGVNDKSGSEAVPMSSWLVLLGIPVAVGLWGLAAVMKRQFDAVPRAWGLYLSGLAVFSAGAFLTETTLQLAGMTAFPPWAIWLEETLEMVGASLLLWSGLLLAEGEGLSEFISPPAPASHAS